MVGLVAVQPMKSWFGNFSSIFSISTHVSMIENQYVNWSFCFGIDVYWEVLSLMY
jgi:hypothetical protein